jgi:hypothetical protein
MSKESLFRSKSGVTVWAVFYCGAVWIRFGNDPEVYTLPEKLFRLFFTEE